MSTPDYQTLVNRVNKLKKQMGFKQVKYSNGPLTGPVTCCNTLGIDYTTGTLYYKDEDGNWALFASGGGGSTPSLQEVTDVGAATTNSIDVVGISNHVAINSGNGGYSLIGVNGVGAGFLALRTDGANIGEIFASNLTNDRTFQLPDNNGTLLSTAGTTTGFPVTGDIAFDDAASISPTFGSHFYIGDRSHIGTSYFDFSGGDNSNIGVDGDIANNAKGIVGLQNFSPNYTDLTYVQKVYVDAIRPYKVFTAIISQSGTSAPTGYILENTIDPSMSFTRITNGVYTISSPLGAFTTHKTTILASASNPSSYFIGGVRDSDNDVIFQTINVSSGSAADGFLNNSTIEIRVYN